MSKIYTYDELNQALRDMKKKSDGVVNTCYYFPAELKEKIESGVITYEIEPDYIAIYEENKDFYNLMFCINNETEKMFINKDKKVGADIVYSSLRPVSDEVKNVLEKSGFSFFAKASFMTKSDFSDTDEMALKNNIVFAKREMAEDIIQLWRETLDPETVYIENYDEVLEKIDKKQVVAVTDENGKVIASMTSDLDSRKNAMVRHVCVSEKARGIGAGKDLLVFYFKQRGIIGFERASLWVEDFRQAAIGLYTKTGFVNSGKEMLRYIKK